MNSPDQEITVMHYNQCYGLPANTLSQYLRSHIPHFRSRTETLRKSSSIDPAMSLIHTVNADVVSLCEVFGKTQREKFEIGLRDLGYQSIHVGQGHGLGPKSSEHVEILLATKMPSEAVDIPTIDVPSVWGHGGGIVCADLVAQQTKLIAAHLAFRNPRARQSYEKQVKVLGDLLSDKEHKSIVAIDSNCIEEELPSSLQDLDYYSARMPTYQITAFGLPIIRRRIDHILGRGFDIAHTDVIDDRSDHRALVSVLNTQ